MLELGHMIVLADAFRMSQSQAVDESTLSWRIFGDTKKLTALRDGRDITVSRFNSALRWFAANWPEDVDWPSDVPRPAPEPAE